MPLMNKSLNMSTYEKKQVNLYLNNKTDTSRIAFIKEHNYCVSLMKKLKTIMTQN